MSSLLNTVKGTAILARLNFVEKRRGTPCLTDARRKLAADFGTSAFMASMWYPRNLYDALLPFAQGDQRSSADDSKVDLGKAEGGFLLAGPYAHVLRKGPAEMVAALPLLFTCVYSDVKLTCTSTNARSAMIQLHGIGLKAEDRAFYEGLVGEALSLCGAVAVRAQAVPDGPYGGQTFRLDWSSAPAARTCEAVPVSGEYGIMDSRSRAREICKAMGFGTVDTVGIATCVSELARNIVNYAGEGTIHLEDSSRDGMRCLRIRAEDHGPGIGNLEAVLNGNHRSEKGMGMGLRAIKKLADVFEVISSPGSGTTVEICKFVKRV
jgi:serine/threonine-protein kinase RsbT